MPSADPDLVFTHARIVAGEDLIAGSLAVRDGVCADVSAGPSDVAGAIDLEGDILAPGLVELHTDNLEKHLMPRANVHWPAFAALLSHDAQVAACGVTTVFDAVALGERDGRTERLIYLSAAVAAMREGRAGHHLRADHFLHLRCEVPKPHVCELFDMYADDPSVRIISLMDHTPGDRQFLDMDTYRQSCLDWYGEDNASFDKRVAEEKALQAKHAVPNRAAIAERSRARGFIIASHDDASVSHVHEARAYGASISEFPTTMDAARAARASGLATIMGAPNVIRGGSHSGNIAAQDLAEAGLLDALSSDYMPISLISAPFRLAEDLGWGLPRAMALVTTNPARMAGLDDRGRIAPGARADLIRIRETPGGPVVRGVWRAGERVA